MFHVKHLKIFRGVSRETIHGSRKKSAAPGCRTCLPCAYKDTTDRVIIRLKTACRIKFSFAIKAAFLKFERTDADRSSPFFPF